MPDLVCMPDRRPMLCLSEHRGGNVLIRMNGLSTWLFAARSLIQLADSVPRSAYGLDRASMNGEGRNGQHHIERG